MTKSNHKKGGKKSSTHRPITSGKKMRVRSVNESQPKANRSRLPGAQFKFYRVSFLFDHLFVC
jgi:hypothetical protein